MKILARDIVAHSAKTRGATNCRVPVTYVGFIQHRKNWTIGRWMMVALKLDVITAQAGITLTKMIEKMPNKSINFAPTAPDAAKLRRLLRR